MNKSFKDYVRTQFEKHCDENIELASNKWVAEAYDKVETNRNHPCFHKMYHNQLWCVRKPSSKSKRVSKFAVLLHCFVGKQRADVIKNQGCHQIPCSLKADIGIPWETVNNGSIRNIFFIFFYANVFFINVNILIMIRICFPLYPLIHFYPL